MNIAIIGFGAVGSALGRRWAEVGHDVTFGVRDPSSPKVKAGVTALGAKLASVPEACAGAEVVVLAVPWSAVTDALTAAGDLSGRVVLDCTNPLKPDLSGLEIGTTTSGGELVEQKARGAKVVKIFNTTGAGNMANPDYRGTKVTMLYAGDDAVAKAIAARLASDIGFEPLDIGPLEGARYLEPFAMAWITLAYKGGLGPDFALNVVRRNVP